MSPSNSTSSIKPIEILRSQYALLYANLHPVLLLSVVVLNFSSLVRDPVPTLLGLAPTITTLQVIYCIVCLPSTGQAAPSGAKAGSKKKTVKTQQDIWAKAVVRRSHFFFTF